ncbi:hypothetical protein MA16_Dca023086 [Dendrobium catenatum]|uniref:Uncharacterized protein n=1 Tax=Dendrobium catenatum TaxID=906689 RepID=A0A2I0VCS5_9ASPA|nr:hypothetical protein MA16_Dca023086 [Dendrobium catenatum]
MCTNVFIFCHTNLDDKIVDQELSKFINQCNEIKAANMASKEGSQLSIIKTEEDASNSSKK